MTARPPAVPAAFLAAILLAPGARAVQPRSVTVSAADLQRGDAAGVATTSKGRIFLAPRLVPVGKPLAAGDPAYVWSAAADDAGNVYLGTGPDGRVVKVAASGDRTVLFTAKEPMVTAVAVLPGGDVLAGTSPEGKVYRIGKDGAGRLWAETKARYVWALAPSRGGVVYAATGDQGIVYRIDPAGRSEPFFDSGEANLVSLAVLPDGSLVAGGAGRGLVYRIDGAGHAVVLHDDELAEVRAVAPAPDGSIVVALQSQAEPERRPPALRIQMGGAAAVATAPEGVSDLEERPGQVLQGVIEGLPEASEEGAGKRVRGKVVRIAADGSVAELWRSATEAPYGLALDADARPVFGTGEPGRIYRVEPDGEVSLLAALSEAQVSALVAAGRSVAVATSNGGASYRLDRADDGDGVFLSRPIDAGGSARWTTLRWRSSAAAARTEVYTRTGNSADPDETWSAWSPALTDGAGSPVVNPPGRFLQWRVKVFGAAGGAGRDHVGAITATYVPDNRAPLVRDLRLEGGAGAFASKVSLRWTSLDPDGDPLSFDVQYRRAGTEAWQTGARIDPAAPKPGDPPPEVEGSWKDGRASWDVSAVDEGIYEVRVIASDQAYNAPSEGRSATADLGGLVVIDRTAPEVEARRTGNDLEVTVRDAGSGAVRLEVVADGKVAFALPASGAPSGPRGETFRIAADRLPAGSVAVRAVDAAGNASEKPVAP